MTAMNSRRSLLGFSLVELLVVICLATILIGLTAVSLGERGRADRVSLAKKNVEATFRHIRALAMFRSEEIDVVVTQFMVSWRSSVNPNQNIGSYSTPKSVFIQANPSSQTSGPGEVLRFKFNSFGFTRGLVARTSIKLVSGKFAYSFFISPSGMVESQ
jgi:Tfp pilus assembly protein FimT